MSREALNPDQFHFAFRQAQPRSMEAQADKTLMYHRLGVRGQHGFEFGSMLWHHKTGEIGNIDVLPEVQRQGVATAMLGHARQLAGETRGVRPPRHSPERTDAGEAWARSLGERLPRRVQ
jgi:GNAT superfamily N-acetyltransferase